MKESEKVKFWLMVSVSAWIGMKIINHHLSKTDKTERGLGTNETRMVNPAPIVDVRAAPGVARVTL